MNKIHFSNSLDLLHKDLKNKDVNRAFNSIGSNVFFEFGQEKDDVQKEWIIWISRSSWRLTKYNNYIVGSCEDPKIIQANIQNLLGKQFDSFSVLSHFFDMEFNFKDGYQLTTFFNCSAENQWTLFFPDEETIRINCDTKNEIKQVQSLAQNYPIKEAYKKIDLSTQKPVIHEITYDEYDFPTFHCTNNISIKFQSCLWRLEKDNEYCIGFLDEGKAETKLSELIGKEIKQIDIANAMMDARFLIGDEYILKTFTCWKYTTQWKILSGDTSLFSARIQIAGN